jgi:hypothetical protein
MNKKKLLCLVLALCALVLTACQQKEVFDTLPPESRATEAPAEAVQDLFGSAVVGGTDYDDGSYDPASEEGGDWEDIAPYEEEETVAPLIQSDYAGATPVVIDPIDKPTPTPLPKITFSYTTYNAPNLHLTFEGPAGWIADDLAADTYILTNPDPSMDYEAKAEIRTIAAGKDYTQKELVKEVKAQAEALQGTGSFQSFSTSDTATRTFINGNGVYIAYKGTLNDGQETGVAGRIIVNTVNKVLYVLHVSYPRGLADTFADGVYNKIRHSMKLTN